ncbi:MAG: DUF2304 domain-containing protein [Deltaproteobacteria bacterium]|nr:DUF2304 domain-containing protein [Deltaproteobacteria bacterium]
MISYKITTGILGAVIFIIILSLVRKGKLQEKYALTWFAIGIVVVLLGIFPVILDKIAKFTGVSYAPALLFVIAVAVLLIQNLYLFIYASQNEVRIKALLQEVAVLNKLVAELREDTILPSKSKAVKCLLGNGDAVGSNEPESDNQEPASPLLNTISP